MTELTCFAAEKPMSVCEVLSNLIHYRWRLVAIQGILRGGTPHGWFLQDNAEDKSCATVEKQGRTWPPEMALVQFTRGSDLEDGPVNFESDTTQIENILSEAKRIVKGRDDWMIVATFIGELRSRKGIRIIRTKKGWYEGDEYAQSGQYPALLVLRTSKT